MSETKFLICSGCGRYSGGTKGEQIFNVLSFKVSDMFIASTGFKLYEENIKLNFCDSCYSKVLDSEMRVRALGSIEKLREDIKKKDRELDRIKEELWNYKNKIANILKEGGI